MRLFLAAALLASAGPALPAAGEAPKTDEDRVAYALGLKAAQSFSGLSLSQREVEMVERGLSDALVAGRKPALDLSDYEQKVQEFATGRIRKTNDEYPAKAAKEKGAQKTASGLVYLSLKEGSGPSPTESDTVKVNYQGKLVGGQVFDSSYKRGQPAEFALGGVITCWKEGLQKMKVGAKARLVCPASLAYGDRGVPGAIPAGSTLVFDLELLEIKK